MPIRNREEVNNDERDPPVEGINKETVEVLMLTTFEPAKEEVAICVGLEEEAMNEDDEEDVNMEEEEEDEWDLAAVAVAVDEEDAIGTILK
jgi:hypothetical protein